jgi:hypothetical protein
MASQDLFIAEVFPNRGVLFRTVHKEIFKLGINQQIRKFGYHPRFITIAGEKESMS